MDLYLPPPGARWLPAPWRSCWPAPPARWAGTSGWAARGWTGGCWTDGASRRTRWGAPCRRSCSCASRTACSGCPRCWRGWAACWSWQEAASGPADFASCSPLHHIWPPLWMSSLVCAQSLRRTSLRYYHKKPREESHITLREVRRK